MKPEDKQRSIDLHGDTVQQALARLEKTLDRALLEDLWRIEIIHGIGSGALKKAVHDYLKQSRHIESYKLDPHNPGTTWAYL